MKEDICLVVVVGPTASGKSGVAMELARKFNGEIIAADSRTVYRGMDIGTAKSSKGDQAEIPHHCLDLVRPGERFTVSDFQKAAKDSISDIRSRGKLPIMVGGTGLYVDSVIFDYDFAARSNQDEALRSELEKLGPEELLERIPKEHRDLFSAQKNPRHMVRFLETGELAPKNQEMVPGVLVGGIAWPKNKLRKRIEQRVELMFKMGLRREVEELIEEFGWDSEALTGIGYREFKAYYDGQISMSKVKRDIVQSSLQYAKRQRTWFRRNPSIIWKESAEELLDELQNKC